MPRAGGGGGSSGVGVTPSAWSVGASAGVSNAPTRPAFRPSGGGGGGSNIADVGAFSVDVTSPSGFYRSIAEDQKQTNGLLEGLGTTLFGAENKPGLPFIDIVGKSAGGLLGAAFNEEKGLFPKNNLIGDVARTAGQVIPQAGNLISDVAEIVPSPGAAIEFLTHPGQKSMLDRRFEAMPDSPEKQAALAEIAKDPLKTAHIKAEALKAQVRAEQQVNPTLTPEFAEASVGSGSLADDLGSLLGILQTFPRPLQRLAAGSENPFKDLSRLQEIEAVATGQAVFQGGFLGTGLGENKQSGLSDMERIAYEKWKDGTWTPEQATDFLVAGGTPAHDPGLSLASSVALDPTVAGSLGAAGLSRLGLTSIRAASAAADAAAGGRAVTIRGAEAATLLSRGAAEAGVTLDRSVAKGIVSAAEAAAKKAKSSLLELEPEAWDEIARGAGVEGQITGDALRDATLRAVEEGTQTARLNVLGKAAQSERVSSAVASLGRTVYTPMQANAIGKAAKIGRTIIDPLHAIGGNRVVGEATVDVTAEATQRTLAEVTGISTNYRILRDLQKIAPELVDLHLEGTGTYGMNIARKVLMRAHVAGALSQKLGRELIGLQPKQIIDHLLSHAPKDYVDLLKAEMIRVRQLQFDSAGLRNLADRMASQVGHLTSDEWLDFLKTKSLDYLSELHASTYGLATKNFLSAVGEASRLLGRKAAKAMKLDRMILLNRTTLTDLGAQGILKELEGLTDEAAAALIRARQAQYPELAYIVLNPKTLDRSIDQFKKWLTKTLEDGSLNHQLTDAEIAKLPDALREFHLQARGEWTLGIRPEDDLLMGLVRDAEGRVIGGFEPWVDHVAVANPGYRGSLAMRYNIAGMPILGERTAKVLDYVEAGARTLGARVSSASITEAARSRFIARAVADHPGLTEGEASQLFGGIMDAAGIHEVTPRGLSAKDMWKATESVIPDRLRLTGEITKRDVMMLVLHAYEGDLRFVGLTQKFTGRMKTVFGNITGGNFAGEFSEKLYQNIRFRYNPVFQLQERLEPIILNGQRGVNFAFGTKLTAADRKTSALYQRMRDTGLIRSSDIDQAEFSALALLGSDLENELGRFATAGRWDQLRDVAGAKRLNLLRTFQNNMGRSMKMVWTKNAPGSWERLSSHYSALAGHLLSDDELAVRILSEGGVAGDVALPGVLTKAGQGEAVFKNAISMREWYVPADIGELRSLDLDFMASVMGFPLKNGTVIRDVTALRAALADHSSGVTMDRIKDALATMNAHPDYIRRVENALDFHWDGFWRTVGQRFDASPAEIKALQGIVERTAEARGMTATDYISQVMSSRLGTLAKGEKATDAVLGNLGDTLSALRTPVGKKLTVEDLHSQLAHIFSAHLDPSAQKTLLDAMDRGLQREIDDLMKAGQATASRAQQKTLETIRGGWDKAASEEFSKRALRIINGGEEASPDVVRAAQAYVKWTRDILGEGLARDNPIATELSRLAGFNTDAATQFNHIQSLMMDQIGHALRQSADDAFRLQYFGKTRTFLERSINHPFFGIYPASYMYGKILPELARFIAKEPFGIRTGAAVYTFQDLAAAIAVQRELDEDFDKMMEDLGHSEVAWFLGYLVPSLPWDISAAAPAWMRDLAQQGLDNQARVDRGEEPKPIDFGNPFDRIKDYVSPLRPVTQIEKPIGEIRDLLQQQPQSSGATAGPTSVKGPVTGVGLAPVVAGEMDALRAILADQ